MATEKRENYPLEVSEREKKIIRSYLSLMNIFEGHFYYDWKLNMVLFQGPVKKADKTNPCTADKMLPPLRLHSVRRHGESHLAMQLPEKTREYQLFIEAYRIRLREKD